MTKFGRQTVIQVGKPGNPGKSWTDLRVDFRVKHQSGRNPNSAKIEVYNWGDDTISLLERGDAVVRLLAGYSVPSILFAGEPRRNGVTVKDDGPDTVTKIEADDGGRAFKNSRLSVSYGNPTNVQKLVETAASQLGLPRGQIQVPENPELSQGVSLEGPTRNVLDRIAEMAGAEWSIQDRRLRLIEKGGDTGREVAKLSADGGTLIGRPQKKDNGAVIKTFLKPEMRPKDRFVVEDDRYGGTWRAEKLTHEGSKWTDKFHTNIKAVKA